MSGPSVTNPELVVVYIEFLVKHKQIKVALSNCKNVFVSMLVSKPSKITACSQWLVTSVYY